MKDCNQCGKCCIKYADGGLVATQEEIDWWEEHRPDIYLYVNDGNIWMDPQSGEQLSYCPWLQIEAGDTVVNSDSEKKLKYVCGIYHDRPQDCRQYPSLIEEMIRDECEMLEAKDINNLKQAQKLLNTIMVDSRSY